MSSPANPVVCPHYPPPTAVNPTFICRGCGSAVADGRHASVQAAGLGNHTFVGRPELVNQAKGKERIF